MSKEKCVVCQKETQYDFETHIDFRNCYVEGVGQLCVSCYMKNESVVIPHSVILDTPNDMELGGKVRNIMYHKMETK